MKQLLNFRVKQCLKPIALACCLFVVDQMFSVASPAESVVNAAQGRKVTGRVVDKDAEPLPGAAVMVDGTSV